MSNRRRRNQLPLEDLSVFSRFLNQMCVQAGLTQTAVAERLKDCSVSMVSRWFRGLGHPTDQDLQQMSQLFGVPIANFRAVHLIENVEEDAMSATLPAWRYIVEGAGERLLLVGVTMLSGIAPLRDFRSLLGDKMILVSMCDPLAEGTVDAINKSAQGISLGRWISYWLAAVSSLREIVHTAKDSRVRLWLRPKDHVIVGSPPFKFRGQIAANDWIALASSALVEAESFKVHFREDESWQSIVRPMMDAMAKSEEAREQVLVWDSNWAIADDRYRKFLQRIEDMTRILSAEGLME